MLPKHGVGHVGKLIKLAADTLWGFNFLGLDKGLDSLSMHTHSLGLVGLLRRLQALLVHLGKSCVPLPH